VFIVSVAHHVKPGRLDAAKQAMTSAAASMISSDGFLFRFLVTPADDPLEVISYTAWQSPEHQQRALDAFVASGAPWPDPAGPDSPYTDVVRRHLEVSAFHLPAGIGSPEEWLALVTGSGG
jgi:hypothetical protein